MQNAIIQEPLRESNYQTFNPTSPIPDSNHNLYLMIPEEKQSEAEVSIQAEDAPQVFTLIPSRGPFLNSLINGLTLCGINCAVNTNIFVSGTIIKAVNTDTLAAYSLIYSETAALVLLFIAPLNAINVSVSRNHKSQSPPEDIARTMQAGCILGAMLSLPALVIASVNKPLLVGLGQQEHVSEIVQAYFWWSLVGWPPLYVQFACGQFISGLQKRLMPLVLDFGVLALSIFLTDTFALGKYGAEELGIKGYALSFSVVNWVNLIGYLLILNCHKDFRHYQLHKKQTQLLQELKRLAKNGMPVMVAYLGEAGIILATAFMAGKLGEQQLITQSVFGLYLVLLTIPGISLFESTSVLISGSIGAKRFEDIRRYMLSNVFLAAICPILALILTLAIPKELMKPFIDIESPFNSRIVDDLTLSLPLLAAGNLFDSTRMVLSGALLGMDDIQISSLVNAMIQLLVIVPLMYALSFHTPLDINGLMTAYLIGSFLLTAYTSVRSYVISGKILADNDTTETLLTQPLLEPIDPPRRESLIGAGVTLFDRTRPAPNDERFQARQGMLLS
ncbi:MAG: hypothetical protein H0U75_06795 [Legionella sp.]|nr:hypothetical protein [Legionella sp.]